MPEYVAVIVIMILTRRVKIWSGYCIFSAVEFLNMCFQGQDLFTFRALKNSLKNVSLLCVFPGRYTTHDHCNCMFLFFIQSCEWRTTLLFLPAIEHRIKLRSSEFTSERKSDRGTDTFFLSAHKRWLSASCRAWFRFLSVRTHIRPEWKWRAVPRCRVRKTSVSFVRLVSCSLYSGQNGFQNSVTSPWKHIISRP